MRKKVPIKNIDPVLVDVRKPGFNYKAILVKQPKLNLSHAYRLPANRHGQAGRVPRRIPLKKPVYIKLIGWSLISLVLVFGVISVLALFNLKEVKTVVLQKSGLVISNFVSSLNFLKDLKPGEASSALAENSRELSGLKTHQLFLIKVKINLRQNHKH